MALPLLVAQESCSGWVSGLRRPEVDAAAKTLTASSMIPSAGGLSHDLGSDRALQIDSPVYYFSGGQLTANAW